MPERISLNVKVNPLDHLKRDIAGNLLNLVDLKVTGLENLDVLLTEPAMFNIFPHTSHGDSMAVRRALAQRHKLVFLAKKEYWDGWKRPFGELTNALILIPTADGTSPLSAFRTAVNCMGEGYSLGIAPEGTRSLGVPINNRKFEDGIGSLLRMTYYKYPLVPVLLRGFGGVWPKGQNLPHTIEKGGVLFQRKPVYVHFGTPKFYQKKDFAEREDLVEDFRQHCIRQYHAQFGASE